MIGTKVVCLLLCAVALASATCNGGYNRVLADYPNNRGNTVVINAPRPNYQYISGPVSSAYQVPSARIATSSNIITSPSTVAVSSAAIPVANNYIASPSTIAVSSATNIAAGPSVTRTNSGRRYRVALDNCGPKSRKLAPISARPVATAPIVAPTVTLPYSVPKTRTVSNNCRCVKIVAKPQPIEQIITVPVRRSYIQTLAAPRYEIINYGADPINCPVQEEYACAY